MSNERFLQIVFVILIAGYVLMLIDRANCQKPDGSPCRFGGAIPVSVPVSVGR
ncbi:MAG: hypothetical protein RO009_05855 [Pseudorhodoplanes sp.]|nr:hypothetical protein [Pseudorhodoplanes sp.]